ncbi:MAG: LCP family protein [Clostridium sp.]
MEKKKMSVKKKVFIGIAIFLLLVIGGASIYVNRLLNKVNRVEIDRNNVVDVGKDVPKEADEIITIALFGTDYEWEEVGAADSTMLLSINPNTGEMKLCSLMRDMYMDLPDGGRQNLNYTMSSGGHELILRTINYNFDLKVDKFVQVDLKNLPKVIDKLGGVELTITSEEVTYLNNYINHIDKNNGTKTSKVTKSGKQVLNGTQAAAYCRIRYTDGRDYKRTERQRDVLGALFNKVKNVSMTEMIGVIEDLLPLVSTNMSTSEMISIGTTVLGMGVGEIQQGRFPLDEHHKSEWTDMYHLVTDLESTKKEIHKFLYGIE